MRYLYRKDNTAIRWLISLPIDSADVNALLGRQQPKYAFLACNVFTILASVIHANFDTKIYPRNYGVPIRTATILKTFAALCLM